MAAASHHSIATTDALRWKAQTYPPVYGHLSVLPTTYTISLNVVQLPKFEQTFVTSLAVVTQFCFEVLAQAHPTNLTIKSILKAY